MTDASKPAGHDVSVLTLVRGRPRHFANLIAGLAGQTRPPAELVVAAMQPEAPPIPADLPFAVRVVTVDGEALPLAKARNAAAASARCDGLIFLDVDCIAAPELVATYSDALAAHDGLMMGEVYYLPPGAADAGLDFPRFDRVGAPHLAKPAMPREGVSREPDPGQLWGLSFALRRDAWDSVGGMDEAFVGYGGEETDFAHRLAAAGAPFYRVAGARAYHQHHGACLPPLGVFDSILANATRFYARHGFWCMDYWLGQFADRGLIDWTPKGDRIRVKRRPTADEIAAARRP